MSVGTKIIAISYLPNGKKVMLACEKKGLQVLGYRAVTIDQKGQSHPGRLTNELAARRIYAQHSNVPGATEEIW